MNGGGRYSIVSPFKHEGQQRWLGNSLKYLGDIDEYVILALLKALILEMTVMEPHPASPNYLLGG